jgi:hypothetical protein
MLPLSSRAWRNISFALGLLFQLQLGAVYIVASLSEDMLALLGEALLR